MAGVQAPLRGCHPPFCLQPSRWSLCLCREDRAAPAHSACISASLVSLLWTLPCASPLLTCRVCPSSPVSWSPMWKKVPLVPRPRPFGNHKGVRPDLCQGGRHWVSKAGAQVTVDCSSLGVQDAWVQPATPHSYSTECTLRGRGKAK